MVRYLGPGSLIWVIPAKDQDQPAGEAASHPAQDPGHQRRRRERHQRHRQRGSRRKEGLRHQLGGPQHGPSLYPSGFSGHRSHRNLLDQHHQEVPGLTGPRLKKTKLMWASMRGRTSGRARPSRVFSATRIAITWRRRPSMARGLGCRHRAAEGRTASPKWARMRASNDPWASKREELQEHSVLLLNNELLTQPSWDEETIRSRNRRMAELA